MVWRLGRRWKDVLNRDFIDFEGESSGELDVGGRMM